MASKRVRVEVEDFDGVDEPLANASVHGVISSLSPTKKGRKSHYFHGMVSNGKSKLRLVGFSQAQQRQMKDFMSKKKPVQLEDCEIKQARRGQKMEIMLKGQTTISESQKKFDVASIDFEDDSPSTVALSGLDSMNVFDRVTVNVKVLKLGHGSSFSAYGKEQTGRCGG